MKRAIFLPLAAAFLLLSFSPSAQVVSAKKRETKAKVKTQNVKMKIKGNLSAIPLPYPVNYSSQFIIGDPAYAKLVLDVCKNFDGNTLDNSASAFADTVAMIMADGMRLQGYQQVFDGAKSYRSSLTSADRALDVVMSVHSIDKDEDWVLVWGTTKETGKNGQTKSIPVHEAWRINKDGKVDLMLQFARTELKP